MTNFKIKNHLTLPSDTIQKQTIPQLIRSAVMKSHKKQIISIQNLKVSLIHFTSMMCVVCWAFCLLTLLFVPIKLSTGLILNHKNVSITNDLFKVFFTLLPVEEKQDMLHEMTLPELLDFMQVKEYEEYYPLATEEYGKSYGHMLVGYRIYTQHGKEPDFVVENNEIIFFNVTALSKFLQSFNKHIKHFKLLFASDTINEVILDSLSKYCASTLKRLQMRLNREHDFDLLNGRSFAGVEEISFDFCRIGNQTVDLKQVFPNVCRFSTFFTEYSTWFDRLLESSDLTHLQVFIVPNSFSEENVLKILQNNHKISYLRLYNATSNIVRSIGTSLSQIRTLVLIDAADHLKNAHEIHMENVGKFSFEGATDYKVPIIFSNLKELKWRSKSALIEEGLIDFIEVHNHTLDSLEIDDMCLSDEHWEHLMHMKELKRISMSFGADSTSVKIDRLINLIKVTPKLTFIRISEANRNDSVLLVEGLKRSGLDDWIDSFELYSRDEGNIHLTKQGHHGQTWKNSFDFFTSN